MKKIDNPVLIIAFNRPVHLRNLINSLRPLSPKKIYVSVDGPRLSNKKDAELVRQVREEIQKIDWTNDLNVTYQTENVGLRISVSQAVSRVLEECDCVIVLEDDVIVGSDFLKFMNFSLDKFQSDSRIGHISGYNLVPRNHLSNPDDLVRLSRYPESYAWATWSDRWRHYDSGILDNKKISKSILAEDALLNRWVWALNFNDASSEKSIPGPIGG